MDYFIFQRKFSNVHEIDILLKKKEIAILYLFWNFKLNFNHLTALHIAVKKGFVDIVEHLLKSNNVDVNLLNISQY